MIIPIYIEALGDSYFNRLDDIFSNPVRAGKRTYFFDVKATRGDDYYITITESKRRMDDNGKFIYDKHKIFLYKEDFDKFSEGFESCLEFIRENKGENYGNEPHEAKAPAPAPPVAEEKPAEEAKSEEPAPTAENSQSFSDVDFDDLGKDSKE